VERNFRQYVLQVQAEWCARNHVEYLVHLNHEETMTALVTVRAISSGTCGSAGPGIDNLNQLIPGAVHTPDGTWNINNNFPKLASSAAHLFGKPKVWTESAGGPGLEGKYALDFQLVRGVNALQIRIPGGRGARAWCRRNRRCWRGTPTGPVI